MELVCSVQHYKWGKKGKKSLVATLAQSNIGINIEEDIPYAEFWMGTHPSGSSIIKSNKLLLFDHLQQNAEELGNGIIQNFGKHLPFLFKVLSVNTALSIQVHPSKSEAEYLFKKNPLVYKDSNHKPEMAIALTEFRALCCFRPINEIKFFLRNVPEFWSIIDKNKIEALLQSSENNLESCKKAMRDCFENLMLSSENLNKMALDNLMKRLKEADEKSKSEFLYDIITKLNQEFPGDVGIFCIYWLNYIILNPGEAIFLAPNEPHAYLSGDCIECMANSDNVIRAGLTPKFRDISTLCQMLSYNCYSKSDVIFKPVKESKFSRLFCPPVKDFAIAEIIIPKNVEYTLPKRPSASILIVIEGKGKTKSNTALMPGSVFYVPFEDEFFLKSDEYIIIIFQAFCNIPNN